MRLILLVLLSGTAYAGNHCFEVSHVVGRQKCGAFGMWGLIPRLPAITLDEGLVEAGSVVSWRTRVSWPIVRPIYMGSEFDLGGVTGAFTTGIHGVLGIHTLVRDTMLSTELAGGERTVEAKTSAIVEARVRLDWWATPHLTLGFALGTSLIDAGASATFSIGMHLRAFDGGI